MPPELAFGTVGDHATIPPGAALWYEVHVLSTLELGGASPPMPDLFGPIDADGNGYLDAAEVAAHFGRLGRAAPEGLWEEDRDGDGLISSAEFSGPQGRVPRAWPLLAELERTAGAGAWLSARQMGARRMRALGETTGSFANPPL